MSVSSSRRRLLARVHIARKERGLDEDTYRALLCRLTGKDSARFCSDAELLAVINDLAVKGRRAPGVQSQPWRQAACGRGVKDGRHSNAPGHATRPRLPQHWGRPAEGAEGVSDPAARRGRSFNPGHATRPRLPQHWGRPAEGAVPGRGVSQYAPASDAAPADVIDLAARRERGLNAGRAPQLRKIEALLMELDRPWEYARGIAARMFRGKPLEFCDAKELTAIITALVKHGERVSRSGTSDAKPRDEKRNTDRPCPEVEEEETR